MSANDLNALLRGAMPQQSLDSEIQRLVRLHGPDAVRAAAKRNTPKRKGRKAEQDGVRLSPFVEEDAILWLDGKDPFELRSNYALAKAVTKQHPGQSAVSTHRRIMGKLARQREFMTLLAAWQIAEKSRPYGDYFRVIEAIGALGHKLSGDILSLADRPRGQLQRYRETIGEPPPHFTLMDIEAALMTRPLPLPARKGIFGLLGQPSATSK